MKKDGKLSARSGGGINYTKSAMTYSLLLRMIIRPAAVTVLLAYLFYDSPAALPFLLPVFILLAYEQWDAARSERMMELKREFRECLISVSAGLRAGYSPENAFRRAGGELSMLYDEKRDMMRELRDMERRLDMNDNLEEILEDFARRSRMEEAVSFSEVFRFAKRSGGNLNRILSSTAEQIGDRIEVEREIRTVTAGKRMEQQILNVIPIGICAYLRISSPGYLDVLYHNLAGVCIMTVCLVVYLAAYLISERITAIEI